MRPLSSSCAPTRLYVGHRSVRLGIRSNMAVSRETLLFRAKLAEEADRFDDMVKFMESIIDLGNDLTSDERNLLSLAYKNKIGSRRTSWRILKSIAAQENKPGHIVLTYLNEVADEIRNIAAETVSKINDKLLSNTTTPEGKTFFFKMAADYHRYRAEIEKEDSQEKKQAAEKSLEAYVTASEAAKSLPAYDPVRLGLALNFSVFFYEVLNDSERACKLAKEALDSSIIEMDSDGETDHSDANLVMNLLKGNLGLWSTDATQVEDLE